MPHRPNPIPRYNGSNLPPQSQLHPNTTDLVTGSRREKDGLPPRHRASSGASEPSPTSTPSSGPPNPNASTTPGGRPSGRALPPPRFQRKQRPPRVQQAIAAAANTSSSSNVTANTTPNSTQSGGRRGAANKEGGSSGQRGGAGTGTLTLGPANNWGAGTSTVVSLSMATINAASARASVVHPPQPPPPLPQTIPTFDDVARMDRSLPPDFLSGMGRGELEGLDPVQLHHRITFGMGRTSTILRNDLYASEYIHHPNSHSILPPNLSGLEQDMYLLSSAGGAGPGGGARDHAATVRARSHSHNHVADTPVSAPYHPTNVAQVQGGSRKYSPIHPSSPYGPSFGLDTPPVLHAATAVLPPHQHRGVDFDHQLRIRSQSLMAPVDSYRPTRESLVFPPSLSLHPTLPPAQNHRPLSFTNALSNPNLTPARYDSTSSMQAQHHLSLNTDLTNDMRSSGSAPQSASGSGPNAYRKPLKSVLKVRKSAPDLIDPGRGSPPPMPGSDSGHGGVDVHPRGQPLLRSREPAMLPDPGFTLPDESLQAQYAHQLRLLQEEYTTKAAKAGKSRRRSVERSKVSPGTNVSHGEGRHASPGMGRNVEYGAQEVTVPTLGRVNLDLTPPSSGGGSTGGHRVAFFEEVKVIDPVESMGTPDAEQAEQDAGGYTSWDDEWTGEGDDDVTEFVYSPSTGIDAGTGGIVERRGIDSESSPVGTETSDFEDDGGSDIGDRGHDDTTRSTRRRRNTGESPPNQQRFPDTISSVESIISPVQAVVHGHEPSPISTKPIDRYDTHGQASLSASADVPSLPPLVEIIAPTPIVISKELEPSEELPKVELPKFDEMDKEDGITGSVMPMSSTDSTESSDSNRTLKTGLANSIPSSSNTTIAPLAPISPVIEEDSSVDQALSSHAIKHWSPRVNEIPTSSVLQRHASPQDEQESVTFPQLPPTLQRLAHRISLGTLPIPQPSHPSFSGMPPLIPGPTPAAVPSLEQYHVFQHAASFDSPLDDDESLRRLSSITSLSSASSGLHRSIFSRPPPSFVPNPASPPDRDLLYGQTTTYGPIDSVSHQNQYHVHNRLPPTPIVLPPVPPRDVRRPPPDSVPPHLQSRRISRQSALADYSSAASVESGSSHGGGTSGTSHIHRARGRSVAGSMLSSTSSGSHHRNLRAPPGSSSSNVLPPTYSSPGVDSLLSQTSSEQWDRGLLSNARSSESLGAVSAASGRSTGSGGSVGQSAGKALGGESIWTMGKEEEARWPLALPSSSGHGHSIQSKAQTQYTLRSLVPQVEAAMSSEPPSSILSSKERVPSLHSGSQHSYELALPNDAFDSFYPSYNPYSLPPAPETDHLHLPLQHSRSAPALPVYEADRVRGAYNDPWRRREFKQSSLRNDWQDNLRYPEEDVGQFQDGPFNQPAPQVQLRSQAPPFAPASAQYSVEQRLPPQASSWSLSIMNPSDPRGTFEIQRNPVLNGRTDSASHPLSASSSRPSTARNALYGGPGAGDARKSIVTLPATGGVFPRYQEVAAPYIEGTIPRPGSSGGRFKSLFKSRDSKVFK